MLLVGSLNAVYLATRTPSRRLGDNTVWQDPMADELFSNQRFKPAPTKSAVDDDSGKDYRTQSIGKTIQVGEAELLAEVDRIPALPAVVQKILTLAGSMSSTAIADTRPSS